MRANRPRQAHAPVATVTATLAGLRRRADQARDRRCPSRSSSRCRPTSGSCIPSETRNYTHTETRWGVDWTVQLGEGHRNMMLEVLKDEFSEVREYKDMEAARARARSQGDLRAADRELFVRHGARDGRALLRRHHPLPHQPVFTGGREGGQPHAHRLRQRTGQRHLERQAAAGGEHRRHARCGREIPRAVSRSVGGRTPRAQRSGDDGNQGGVVGRRRHRDGADRRAAPTTVDATPVTGPSAPGAVDPARAAARGECAQAVDRKPSPAA